MQEIILFINKSVYRLATSTLKLERKSCFTFIQSRPILMSLGGVTFFTGNFIETTSQQNSGVRL